MHVCCNYLLRNKKTSTLKIRFQGKLSSCGLMHVVIIAYSKGIGYRLLKYHVSSVIERQSELLDNNNSVQYFCVSNSNIKTIRRNRRCH